MKEGVLTRLNEVVQLKIGGTAMVSAADLQELILEQGADERNVLNAMEQIAEMSKKVDAAYEMMHTILDSGCLDHERETLLNNFLMSV